MQIFNNIQPRTVDIVLTSVPWTNTHIPLMATAALKSIAVQEGRSCAALDLNANVYEWSKQYAHQNKLVDFFYNETAHREIEDDVFELYRQFAETLLAFNPQIIGLSLLTYACQVSAKYICYFVRKLRPEVEIIIGGTGCFENMKGHSFYADELLESGLIDCYIRGDGEHAWREFVRGNRNYPGINRSDWQQLSNEDLAQLPYPDYDDYDFSLYELAAIPVLGSRGCVRTCTFCDIIEHWTRFSYRTGENIFKEMLLQNQRYGIRNFKFQDSLINGNLREYKNLIQLLADHNQQHPDNAFAWSSYFIFRPKSTFDETWWQLTALSGANQLLVGVESLSEHIRYHMGKKFSNEDIEFSLQMAKKYQLNILLLMIVGYVTETEADIDFAEQWYRDHAEEYRDVVKIQLGGTMGIFPDTWLDRNKRDLNIVTFGPPYQHWNNTATGSTPRQRAEWQQRLFGVCRELGYYLFDDIDNHYVLELMMNGKV